MHGEFRFSELDDLERGGERLFQALQNLPLILMQRRFVHLKRPDNGKYR